jgi:hypothetical protein
MLETYTAGNLWVPMRHREACVTEDSCMRTASGPGIQRKTTGKSDRTAGIFGQIQQRSVSLRL